MFRKILVAYDGSAGADRALAVAVDLAATTGAALSALAVVVQIRFPAMLDEVEEETQFGRQFYEKRLASARERATEAGVALETMLEIGHPARTIVDVAKRNAVDLVVLGHRGHSEVWAMFLGTTTEKVSRYAPCSVLIVR